MNNAVPVREGEILAGKFRVERILGIGGMGVVVAATHLQLEQRVALKFVLPAGLQNAEAVERFSREARAAVRLRSEHVARVLDVGTMDSGSPYIVMEFLEGRDLATLLVQDGPLPVHDAIDFVMQACEAIAEAHSLGIIHRDLKPRNLFLTRRVDGRPLAKVLDFGISKVTSAPGADGNAMSLTRTTEVMGSPNYMSPEQLRSSRNVDARTDIWSLGVILYELLSGRVPFEAETVTQLCAMVLQDTPRPLEERRPDLPPGLSAVILHCLEKLPAQRFQSVAELAHALEPFAARTAVGAAARISSVASRGVPTGPNPLADSSQSRVAVTGGTSVSWGETELATTRRSRAPLAIGLVVLGAIVVAGGVLVTMAMRKAPPPPADPVIATATIASPPSLTSPQPSSATSLASAPTASTASTASIASATAQPTHATANANAPPTSPIATTKPRPVPSPVPLKDVPSQKPAQRPPATSPDEMPNERH